MIIIILLIILSLDETDFAKDIHKGYMEQFSSFHLQLSRVILQCPQNSKGIQVNFS